MSKRSGFKKLMGVVAGLSLSILGAAKAQASYTTIGAPAKGEQSVAQILTHVYGNETAIRVPDQFDNLMPFDIKSAKAIASFASYKQTFGYGTINNDHELFAVKGTGYNVSGSVGAVNLPFLTQLIRGGTGQAESSLALANVDGKDHMVTYLLEPTKNAKTLTFVVFFEDKTVKQHSDFDFNDLAVEIKVGNPCAVVPLPAAAWSGLATLAGGVVMTGYRKARRQMA